MTSGEIGKALFHKPSYSEAANVIEGAPTVPLRDSLIFGQIDESLNTGRTSISGGYLGHLTTSTE